MATEQQATDKELADDIRTKAQALADAINEVAERGISVELDISRASCVGFRARFCYISVSIERVTVEKF